MSKRNSALMVLASFIGAVCLGAFLFVQPAGAISYFTLNPAISGMDNLPGAQNTSWNISGVVTAALDAGDVVQFVLPTVTMGAPFTLTSVSSTAISGITLYSSLTGGGSVNLVNNPSFESDGMNWNVSSTGMGGGPGYIAPSAAISSADWWDGSKSALLFSGKAGLAPQIGVASVSQGVSVSASTQYTLSYYAWESLSSVNSAIARTAIAINPPSGCGGGQSRYYNFSNSSWECANNANVFDTGSNYASSTDVSSEVRFIKTITTPSDGANLTITVAAGGSSDLTYNDYEFFVDAVQLEEGSSATAFTTGSEGPTPGVDGEMVGTGPGSYPVIFGYVSSSVATSTSFNLTVQGINNPIADLGGLGSLNWYLKGGTLSDTSTPSGDLVGGGKFSHSINLGLNRAGVAMVSDANTDIILSDTSAGAANVDYTFVITASSSIPVGGTVVINFPTAYDLSGVTVNLSQDISDNSATTLSSYATDTSSGVNRIILTTTGEATGPGAVLSVTIGGIDNPATADPYQPFYLYTTKENNGLIDGSFYPSDTWSSGPPPINSVHIGGTNNLHVVVKKMQTDGSISLLNASDRAQVKIMGGCPDRMTPLPDKWLNSNSAASFSKILDCNYMLGTYPLNQSNPTFYQDFLAPSMKQVPVFGNKDTTTTLMFAKPDTEVTMTVTNGIDGVNAYVMAISGDYTTMAPVFKTLAYDTLGFNGSGIGYVKMQLRKNMDWSFTVVPGGMGQAQGTLWDFETGIEYWPPAVPSQYITGDTNLGSYAFITASKDLTVSLKKVGDLSDVTTGVCVGVKRSGGGFFSGNQKVVCDPGSTGSSTFDFKIPEGSLTITVMRPGRGLPDEYPIFVKPSDSTITKQIFVSMPSGKINVVVQDGSGKKINGVPVAAYSTSGYGQGMTNSSGVATLYLPAGTYSIEGFAPGLGQLSPNTGVALSDGGNITSTLTANTASFNKINGRVTQNGVGVYGVQIGAFGPSGSNNTQTDADGYYVLHVRPGTYTVNAWSGDIGGLAPITGVNVSSGDSFNNNWVLGENGTLKVVIDNALDINPMFTGAFNPATGRGAGSDTWMVSGTQKIAYLRLPAGTYMLGAGSPLTGPIIDNWQVTVNPGEEVTVNKDAASEAVMYTLEGTIDVGGNPLENITVWASTQGGQPGYYSTVTDASGYYSMKVKSPNLYLVGAKSVGYVPVSGNIMVHVAGSNATVNMTMQAPPSIISGNTVDQSLIAIPGSYVTAKKMVGTSTVWVNALSQADGSYVLAVDSGDWEVIAQAPCYMPTNPITVSTGATGVNVTMEEIAGCSVNDINMQGISPGAGGQIAQDNLIMDIPGQALGTGQETISIGVKAANMGLATANATPLADAIQSITATDNTGKSIVKLNGKISLSLTYDESDLPLDFDEKNLTLGYFDPSTMQWEAVATTVNTTTNQLTAQIDHFTDYGPILPGTPSAPTGLTAAATSSSQIDLSWNTVSNADYYIIYATTTDLALLPTSTAIATTSATSYNHTGLGASTTWYYKVAGVNDNGEGPNSSRASSTTFAPVVPSAPTGLAATPSTTTRIDLTWDAVSGADYYSIYQGVSTSSMSAAATTSVTSYGADGLGISTLYYFYVTAINGYGESTSSSIVSTSTFGPPEAPGTLPFTNVTTSSLTVNWSAASGADYYSLYRSTDGSAYSPVATTTLTNHDDTGLTPNTLYYYQVSGINAYGEGPTSTAMSTNTLALAGPGAPTGLMATATSAGSIDLSWTSPGGSVDYFTVYHSLDDSTYSAIATTSYSTVTYSHIMLATNTLHYYKVSAVNGGGEATSTATGVYTYAAPPSSLVITNTTTAAIAFLWAENSNPVGTVYEYTVGAVTNTTTATSTSVSGLSSNTQYTAYVRAVNGGGIYTGQISDSDWTKPADPQSLALTASTTDSLTFGWSANNNPTGTVYVLYGDTISNVYTSSTSYMIDGLIPATTYLNIAVKAVSHEYPLTPSYISGASTLISASTKAADPDGLVATASSTNSVSLEWNDNGNTTTAVYQISGSGFATVTTTATSSIISGLSPNTSYTFTVKTQNPDGSYTPGVFTGSYTKAADALSAVITASSTNSLTAAWDSNGNPTGTVYRIFDTGSKFTPFDTANNPETISGLAPNTLYYVAVESKNSDDTYNFPTIVIDSTLAAVPGTPAATPISSSQISISWNANSNPTTTVYEVAGGTATVTTTATTTVIDGLSSGNSYQFAVRAQNLGDGNWSAYSASSTVVSTWSRPTVSTSDASNITATGARLNGAIVADNGASSTRRGFYYGTVSPYTFFTYDSGPFGQGTFYIDVLGLATGTPHQFMAMASNTVGIATGTTRTFITNFDPTSGNPTSTIDATYTATSTIPVPLSVTNATIDMSSLESGGSATTPGAISVDSVTSIGTVQVDIPGGTIITGTGWDGVLALPSINSSSSVVITPDSGYIADLDSVVEIGFGDTALTFNRGVRILLPGKAGKYVGYWRNSTFTKITATCPADSQAAGDALGAGADCKINVSGDLVIWTKHFTSFVTYTQTSTGGGGGSGYDNAPPYSLSISVNSGATSTCSQSVTLTLGAIDASQMIVSNRADFSGSSWEAYAAAKSWMLDSATGTKTVYVKFRDSTGNVSEAVSDSIIVPDACNVIEVSVCGVLKAGDMVKVIGKPAIYALNNRLEVLYFPSGDEFKSWRPTYGGYIRITQECFDSLKVPAAYPGAVNYRSGTYVVKRPSSDQLYVVKPNNSLAKISPAAAASLYGSGYAVMTVSDVFWPHYVNRGADVAAALPHEGMLIKVNNATYYVDAGNILREVSADGMTANGFQTRFVRTLSSAAISGFTVGEKITVEVPVLTNKAQ